MIIRETEDHFIFIKQTHHATLSGLLAKGWKEELFPNDLFRRSVEYAAAHHDVGWARFDKAPFWNDKTHAPYSFNDFPDIPKTVLYKHGIDSVMEQDLYAALLCSVHFANFYKAAEENELIQFVQTEKERQKYVRSRIDAFNEEAFAVHYDILQLVDGLSLFVCLNEPETPTEEGHPFFRKGLPVSKHLGLDGEAIYPKWLDKETVALNLYPFDQTVEGTIHQKKVFKSAIAEKGLLDSYAEAFEEEMTIRFVPQEN